MNNINTRSCQAELRVNIVTKTAFLESCSEKTHKNRLRLQRLVFWVVGQCFINLTEEHRPIATIFNHYFQFFRIYAKISLTLTTGEIKLKPRIEFELEEHYSTPFG